MSTKLPSGLVIFNATPHDLYFWCGEERGVVIAPSDNPIRAVAKRIWLETRQLGKEDCYEVVQVIYLETQRGRQIINACRKENPNMLIVGSLTAASAYPEVVATLFVQGYSEQRLVSSNTFNQGDCTHASQETSRTIQPAQDRR